MSGEHFLKCGQTDALTQPHALHFIDKQGVGLDLDVIFQIQLTAYEAFVWSMRVSNAVLELRDIHVDFTDFFDQAEEENGENS